MSHFNTIRQLPETAFRKNAWPVMFLLVNSETGAVLGELQRQPTRAPDAPKIVVPAKAVR